MLCFLPGISCLPAYSHPCARMGTAAALACESSSHSRFPPSLGTEQCPELGASCPPHPEGCARFSCPARGIPPGTAAAPHPGVPPCPPQGPELGQSPAPRAHSRLEPCHGSWSCCDKDGAASPCNGIRPRGWWWRRGQGQRLPLHPNLWRITALAPYVALPSQPRAAPAT